MVAPDSPRLHANRLSPTASNSDTETCQLEQALIRVLSTTFAATPGDVDLEEATFLAHEVIQALMYGEYLAPEGRWCAFDPDKWRESGNPRDWECSVCGVDTFTLGEDFYIHDHLWRSWGGEGVLCIGCLEDRMGRRLTPEDFKGDGGGPKDNGPDFPDYRRSDRFNDRVRGGQ